MCKETIIRLRFRLSEYKFAAAKLKALKIKLAEVNQQIGIKGVSYDSIGTSYGISNTVEKQALKLIQIKEELEWNIAHKGLEVDKIENALTILDACEREVIELKYIAGHKWETVAYKLNKSAKTIKRIEKIALEKIIEILNYADVH